MSTLLQPMSTPASEFQSHFQAAPGSADAAAECKKWENLCGELLAERQKLREELAKAQKEREQYLKSVYHLMCKNYMPPPFTKEQALAHLDDKPTFEELIAELDREYAQRK